MADTPDNEAQRDAAAHEEHLSDKLRDSAREIERKTREAVQNRLQAVEDRVGEVRDKVGGVRERANSTLSKLESVFDERVAQTLNRLGIPSRREIENLQAQVAELRAILAEQVEPGRSTDAPPDEDGSPQSPR